MPLVIMVGSFQFAPLRFRNTLFVAFHIYADPLTSIYNLCQKSKLPKDIRRDVAILLAGNEDWHSLLCYVSAENTPFCSDEAHSSTIRKLMAIEELLKECRESGDSTMKEYRIDKIQLAARELSDSRLNGLGKTSIGTLSYLVALGMAFVRVTKGEFNNRTGHSLAFGLLWTGLLVIIRLSSISGVFVTKRSTRTILFNLQKNFDALEEAQHFRRPYLQRQRRLGPLGAVKGDAPIQEMIHIQFELSPPIFTFHLIENRNIKSAYESLEGMGMNYCTTPSQVRSWKQKALLVIASFCPVGAATGAAIWISYTSPTSGVGCRNIQQLLFLIGWVVSGVLTLLFRWHMPERQLWLTRIKDLVFGLALIAFFVMGFVGTYSKSSSEHHHMSQQFNM